ncbi:MAG: HNH endonuclease [Kiritimatiellae bacterium]|nr:HNH endonuclease [Kiritimatiellia bacterium]
MVDKEVQNDKGIYECLLSGGTRREKLNLRQFDDDEKRAAYEMQKGMCPRCGQHFEIEEMEGDHIVPWSKGGKTVPENLQMLCRRCNALKGDRWKPCPQFANCGHGSRWWSVSACVFLLYYRRRHDGLSDKALCSRRGGAVRRVAGAGEQGTHRPRGGRALEDSALAHGRETTQSEGMTE